MIRQGLSLAKRLAKRHTTFAATLKTNANLLLPSLRSGDKAAQQAGPPPLVAQGPVFAGLHGLLSYQASLQGM